MLDYSEVAENRRVVKTEKSSFTIELDRQNHIWYVTPASGPTPAYLSGGYTSAQNAKLAIQNYLNIRDKGKH